MLSTLYVIMIPSFWFYTKTWDSPLYVMRSCVGYNFKTNLYFSFYEDHFCIIANSVEPDEMRHYAAFHLGLHCL